MPESKLLEVSSEPIVTVRDVQSLVNEKAKAVPELVASLPQAAKAILCVATTLAQENVQRTTITYLKNFSRTCIEKSGASLDNDEFIRLLQMLQDQGLLSIEGANVGAQTLAEISSQQVSLGVQLEDVVKAVKDELSQGSSYFERLRGYVQNHRHELEIVRFDDSVPMQAIV